jgi:hypothetical protein
LEDPEQIVALPEILPGIAGVVLTVTAKVCGVDDPHAPLAITDIFPLELPAVVLMLVVVDVPLQPPGNVHVYDVAPATGAIEYVCALPEQTVVFPVIVPGCETVPVTVTVT